MTQEHPGKITYVNLDTGASHDRAVADVPESVAWAVVRGERIPVVRVEAQVHGDQRTIRSYAADGRLLSSTVQVRRR